MDAAQISVSILLPVALIIWIVLSFTQKRTKLTQDVCGGRPAVVYPINFLDPRHRLVYALACASQASFWLKLLTITFTISIDVDKWVAFIPKAIVLFILVIVVILITYPMLACVEAPIPIVGYTIGCLYSLLYFVLTIYQLADLLSSSSGLPSSSKAFLYGLNIAEITPQLVCILAIIIWYFYKLIKEIRRICLCGEFWKQAIFEQPQSMNHSNYVKELLSHLLPIRNGKITIFKSTSTSKQTTTYYIYYKIRLPLPILIVTAVAAVVIFQLTLVVTTAFPYLFDMLADKFERDIKENPSLKNVSFYSDIPDLLHGLTAISVLAPLISTGLSVGLFVHLLYTVRKEILEIRRGKADLCKALRVINWPALKLASAVRYSGYQIASIITGWMFYTVVFFCVGLLLIGAVGLPSKIGYYLYILLMSGVVIILIRVVQIIMCKFAFLSSESNEEKTIILNNRRVFNSFTYFMLLYNVATGLYTSIMRVLVAILLTLLVKPRLDRIVFIAPFQRFDTGHSMYRSFMIMEAMFHNPIVHVFIKLLSEQLKRKKEIGTYYSAPKPSFRVSLKAKNRWFVAYTLIKNPGLKRGQRYQNDPCDDKPELNEELNEDLIGLTNPLYNHEENYYNSRNVIN